MIRINEAIASCLRDYILGLRSGYQILAQFVMADLTAETLRCGENERAILSRLGVFAVN